VRRIFFEIYFSSFLCFFIGIILVSYYFQNIRPDYERQLDVAHVTSFARVVNDITLIDKSKADHAIDEFVKESFFDVKVISWDELNNLREQQKSQLRSERAISIEEDEYILYVNETLYYLFPDKRYDIWDELEYEDDFLFFWFGGCFLLFSLLTVYLLHRRLIPLEQATTQFAQGDLTARASDKNAIKLGTLNRQFNVMAQKVSQVIASQKQLTNAVAHELRTPLFRMECQLALLEEMDVDPAVKRHLDGLTDDIEELEQLVEELLYYARLEGVDIELSRTEGNVFEWLEPLVTKLQLVSRAKIILECDDSLILSVDHGHLKRALSNLITNATRYANSEIIVSVQWNEEQIEFLVSDDGPGIPESEYEKVIQPFYRIGTARDRNSGGHGLGLSIVEQVSRGHHGSLTISRNTQQGATFLISIPHAKH
jgi:two-component system sensor histidine kinase RstB